MLKMFDRPTHGLFIVGCDTGVGKTHVGCLLLQWLRELGLSPGVYKPAESGFDERQPEGSDAYRLWQAAGRPLTWQQVCPQRFFAPLAPDQAALREDRMIDSGQLRQGLKVWKTYSEFVIVEGAGGILSPMSKDEVVLDLAIELGYPVVLVVDDSIGAINRALLSLNVAGRYRGGVPLAGWVLNQTSSEEDESRLSNAQEIQKRTDVPLLAKSTYGEQVITWKHEALAPLLPKMNRPSF